MDYRQLPEDVSSSFLPPEYSALPPEDAMAKEASAEDLPPEDGSVPREFFAPSDGETTGTKERKTGVRNADAGDPAGKKRRDRVKRFFLMPVAATVAATSILFASVGYDPLSLDIFAGSSSSSAAETADASFPSLPNLSPNGNVPGWGVLNEEFVRIENGSSFSWIVAGTAYVPAGITTVTVPGITYDASTNTITLNNYTGPALNINLMGNGLRLNVVGTNALDHLLVWGFGYGGSLTVTGTGTLTVNASNALPYGILLRSEDSQTCLMVDSGVTLESYGTTAAVYVEDTKMQKAIYYKSALMTGGSRGSLPSDTPGCSHYTVIDPETGLPASHVLFQS